MLVVDDQRPTRIMLRLLLTAEGYAVVEAVSGGEALALLQSRVQDFKAIVLDYHMPGMSGIELLRALGFPQAVSQWPPVVMHTSEVGNADFDRQARALGVRWTFHKSGSPMDLMTMLAVATY